jgi:hypothetical protein
MIWPTNGSSRRNAARDLPFRYSFCGGHGGIGQSMTTQRGFSSAIVLMDESGDLVI